MTVSYNDVIVQKMYRSRRARGKHKFARQRKGLGTIDLRGVYTMKAFQEVWKDTVRKKGMFSLLARDRRSRKCVTVSTEKVTNGL